MNVHRLLPLLCALGLATELGAAGPPDWLVVEGLASFELPVNAQGKRSRARLRLTADFADVAVLWDGRIVARIEPYDPPLEIDLLPQIKSGGGLLSLRAEPLPGAPAALAASLELTDADGSVSTHSTSGTWRLAGGGTPRSAGPVDPRRWASNQLPEVSPFAEYNQWKEALSPDGRDTAEGARLSPLPPGFQIERIRTAQAGEDSWVSLAIDPKGRLLIAREQRGLLRLTLSDNGREVVSVEVVDDTLRECRGLAWKDGALFANANNTKGLYRLRDTDGDDRFDEILLVQTTEGGVGHGRNDLAVGPDGSLNAIHGDDIGVPGGATRRTVPEPGAPRELGHWVRIPGSPPDNGWEIMARGLRNPYGIDFNADGEAFTYDADNEGDVGLPFYRPTRINHLVSGANYGWHQDRGNTRSLPVWAPDSVPTTFDVGRGSPTGVKFGTRSRFPAPWKDALFALDWAYGRIVVTHLVARGASYHASGGVFLEGRPLNVTDLDFDAAGDLWFVTGGRKTQSALYRIRYTGETTAPLEGDHFRARAEFSATKRAARKALEAYHGKQDPEAVEAAWSALGDADPWMRNAARVAVESQPSATWRERALASGEGVQGLTALLALVRVGNDADRAEVREKVVAFDAPPGWSRTAKLTWLRILELAASVQPDEPARDRVSATLQSWLPDLSPEVNREATRRLAVMGAPSGVAWALRFLGEARDQGESLHYLEVLSEAGTGWTPGQRTVFFRSLAHAKRFSNGDRFMTAFFQEVEKNALANAPENERNELADLLKEAPESAPTTPARPFVRHWTMADFSGAQPQPEKHDPARGKALFTAALCARCHVCGTEGRPVGPDLTTVASRFSRADLLESVLDPSKVVAEIHRNVVIQKTDGSTVMGRVIQNDFRQSLLHLSVNPFAPAETVQVAKADIAGWEESPISPMPPALLDTLTREEIADLLGWIEAGGK